MQCIDEIVGDTMYEIFDSIGSGSYGTVCMARVEGRESLYAIKKMSMIDDKGKDISPSMIVETSILQTLNYPGIIKTLGFYRRDRIIYMVMPYGGPSLSNLVLSSQDTRIVMQKLLRTEKYLEDNKVIHRDIKPANIVMRSDIGELNPILIDFGISSQQGIGTKYTNVVTLWWRHPVLIAGLKNYDNRIDIWSLGVVMYNLLTGKHLFVGRNSTEYLVNVLSCYREGYEWYDNNRTNLPNIGDRIRSSICLEDILIRDNIDKRDRDMILYMLSLDYRNVPTPSECLTYMNAKVYNMKIAQLPSPYPAMSYMSSESRISLFLWLFSIVERFDIDRQNLIVALILFDRYNKAISSGYKGTIVIPNTEITPGQGIHSRDRKNILYSCFYLSTIIASNTMLGLRILKSIDGYEDIDLLSYSLAIYEACGYNIQCNYDRIDDSYIYSLMRGDILDGIDEIVVPEDIEDILSQLE